MRSPIKSEWTERARIHHLGFTPDGRVRKSIDASVGQINYHDGLEFQEIDPTPQFEDDGIHAWLVDRAPYRCRIGRRGNRRIWPDRNKPGQYFAIGNPLPVNSNGWIEGRGFRHRSPDFDLEMDFGNTRIKLNVVLHRDLGISHLDFPFTRNNISKLRALGMLRGLVVTDAKGEERQITVTFIGEGLVRLSWDATGLVYPVCVDPTIDTSPVSTNDDCYFASVNDTTLNFFNLSGASALGASGTSILGNMAHFEDAPPQGTQIDVAYVEITSGGIQNASLVDVEGWFHAADVAGEVDSLALAEVVFQNPTTVVDFPDIVADWPASGVAWRSPSMVVPVQENVDRALFNGTSLTFCAFSRGTPAGANKLLFTDNFTTGTPIAIHIEYSFIGPAAPANPAATPGIEKNTLTWDNVVDAVSYNLYWLETSPVTQGTGNQITGVTSPYEHTGRTPGTEVFYVVTAVDVASIESDDSTEVSATPTAVPAPSNPVAAAGVEANTITWDDVPEASSFNIYWALTTGVTQNTGTKIAGATSPHVHSSLIVGQPYFYVITSESITESVDSAEVTATPLPAHVPPFDGTPGIRPLLSGTPGIRPLLSGTPGIRPLLSGTPGIDHGD